MEDFLKKVNEAFAPLLTAHKFVLVEQQTSGFFGDALAVFQSGDLRLRVVRYRGQVFLDFGPAAEPEAWLDSVFVAEYLDGMGEPEFVDSSGGVRLQALARYVAQNYSLLEELFSPNEFGRTKEVVTDLHQKWEHEAFGRPLPGGELEKE